MGVSHYADPKYWFVYSYCRTGGGSGQGKTSTIMWLFTELKRRNVIRVGTAYLVTSWLLIQVAETIFPLFGLGGEPARIVVILLAIGFPLVIVFAWLYELTPEGLMLERDVDRSRSIVHDTGKRLDRAIIVVLALAVGYFAFDKFVLDPERDAIREEAAAQQARSEALVESFGERSIAVLAFENLSDDVSNEYFSDGISEELLNLLANIPELRVISRSSAFSFKDKDLTIPEIAQELRVDHILEGSVRKAGKQVRITAQLIEARTDTHLWSETYDRELDNIFAIQDEIAAKVVELLKLTILGDVPKVTEHNAEAYALGLQARYLGRQRTPDALQKSIDLLERALELDPGYTTAWADLAGGYTRLADQGLIPIEEGYTLALEAANRALALDPEEASAHARLGLIAVAYDRDLGAAAQHYRRALALEPGNVNIIGNAANMSRHLDRLDQAIALGEYAVVLDPVNPFANSNLGLSYLYAGRPDQAISAFETALTLSPGFIGAHYFIGTALLMKGEFESALASMQREADEGWRLMGLVMAQFALGREAASEAALTELIEKYESDAAYNIAYVLAFRGESDRAFAWLDKAVAHDDPGLAEIASEPLFANIHSDPRWLPFLQSIGKAPEQLAAIDFEVMPPD